MLRPVVVAMDACRPSVLLLWLLQSISRVTAVAASGVEYCQRLPHEATLLCTEAMCSKNPASPLPQQCLVTGCRPMQSQTCSRQAPD